MAISKTIERSDGSTANYIRLVTVTFPSYSKDGCVSNGQLGFDIYLSEEAAKTENKSIFMSKTYSVDKIFFNGLSVDTDWNSICQFVYTNISYFPELDDATAC
jgi:hypothetical protein